jgi:hypothetical protein
VLTRAPAHRQAVEGEGLKPRGRVADLVVPAEADGVEIDAERDLAGREMPRLRGAPVAVHEGGRALGLTDEPGPLLLEHVEQGLVVHQLVLDDEVEDATPRAEHVGCA